MGNFLETVEDYFYKTLKELEELQKYCKNNLDSLKESSSSLETKNIVKELEDTFMPNYPDPDKYNQVFYTTYEIFDLLYNARMMSWGDYLVWCMTFGTEHKVSWQGAVTGASEHSILTCNVVRATLDKSKDLSIRLEELENISEKPFSSRMEELITKIDELNEKLIKTSCLFKQHNEIERYPELEEYRLYTNSFDQPRELGRNTEGNVRIRFYSSLIQKKHREIHKLIERVEKNFSTITYSQSKIIFRIIEESIVLNPELGVINDKLEEARESGYEVSSLIDKIRKALAPTIGLYSNLESLIDENETTIKKRDEDYNKLQEALKNSNLGIAEINKIIDELWQVNKELQEQKENHKIIDQLEIEEAKSWGLAEDRIIKTEDIFGLINLKLSHTSLCMEIVKNTIDEMVADLPLIKEEFDKEENKVKQKEMLE